MHIIRQMGVCRKKNYKFPQCRQGIKEEQVRVHLRLKLGVSSRLRIVELRTEIGTAAGIVFPFLSFWLSRAVLFKRTHGLLHGLGFLISSMSPAIFLRNKLCMFFSSISLSFIPGTAAATAILSAVVRQIDLTKNYYPP